jgi:hypothetical protein
MSGEEYMRLIDVYASATLTGMLALSASQENFNQEDLQQICDTAFTIAKLMIQKRNSVVLEVQTAIQQQAPQA